MKDFIAEINAKPLDETVFMDLVKIADQAMGEQFTISFEAGASPATGSLGHLPDVEKLGQQLLAHAEFLDIAAELNGNCADTLLFRRLIKHVNETFAS